MMSKIRHHSSSQFLLADRLDNDEKIPYPEQVSLFSIPPDVSNEEAIAFLKVMGLIQKNQATLPSSSDGTREG